MQVVIDGAFSSRRRRGGQAAPSSALFPVGQFPGINTALGVATFDSTTLTNGVHTLSWLVTDNLGSASGIGSRYFTVSNGSGLTMDPGSFRPTAPAEASAVKKADATGRTENGGSLVGRRGFDPATPYETYEADADGRVTIQAEQLDRIELLLGLPTVASAEAGLPGYQRVGDTLQSLPIGSHLDPDTGTFTWNPCVGFLGTYDLMLGGRNVRIVLNPQAGTHPGTQVVIDMADGHILAGWAADLQAAAGTGVDAVHVWACRRGGGAPIFVGAAEYGGARPDVAAVHGARF